MFPGLPMQACGSWIVGLALVSTVQAHSPEPPNGTERGSSAPGLVCTQQRGRGGYVLASHTKVQSQVAGDLHTTRQHRPILTPHGMHVTSNCPVSTPTTWATCTLGGRRL